MAVDSDGCGETKGCYRVPSGCSTADCSILITWTESDIADTTKFGIRKEIDATTDHYAAIGFSLNQRMSDTDVWGCLELEDNTIVLDHSHNTGYTNTQYSTNGGELLTACRDNDILECTFTRQNSLTGSEEHYYDLSEDDYHLIVARGPRLDQDPPKLAKHTVTPTVTEEMIDFMDIQESSGCISISQHFLFFLFFSVFCCLSIDFL